MEMTRAEQAYQSIRQGIVDGLYSPAQRLVENELAQSMGVSRISVRAALQRLQHEGLVTAEPHRGVTVTQLTLEDALQVMELREGLEGWAAGLAAQRVSGEVAGELQEVLAQMDAVVREGRLLEFGPLDNKLHATIIDAAGNPRLGSLIESLKLPVVRFHFSIILIPGRGQESIREHSEVVTAIIEHRPDEAEKAMRRHVAAIRRNVMLLQSVVPPTVQAKKNALRTPMHVSA